MFIYLTILVLKDFKKRIFEGNKIKGNVVDNIPNGKGGILSYFTKIKFVDPISKKEKTMTTSSVTMKEEEIGKEIEFYYSNEFEDLLVNNKFYIYGPIVNLFIINLIIFNY